MAFLTRALRPFKCLDTGARPLLNAHLPSHCPKMFIWRCLTSQNTPQRATLDPHEPIEEDTLPHYDHRDYYPVRLGEVMGEKYKVISKLGYG